MPPRQASELKLDGFIERFDKVRGQLTTLEQIVVVDDTSTLSSLAAVRGLGTTAVRAGVDHLLLVIAIVLPTALVAAGRSWSDGAPSLGAALILAGIAIGVGFILRVTSPLIRGLEVRTQELQEAQRATLNMLVDLEEAQEDLQKQAKDLKRSNTMGCA